MMFVRGLAAGLIALSLTGCAETARFDAAGDVQAFLVAVRDGDRAGFDAHVDRPLLKEQIRARLLTAAAKHGGRTGDLAVLGLVLARPVADSLVDALIQPDVFLAVAESFGYSPQTPVPNTLVIAGSLRRIDDDHVCASPKKDGACLLIFRDEGGVWRLIGFDGDTALLRSPKL